MELQNDTGISIAVKTWYSMEQENLEYGDLKGKTRISFFSPSLLLSASELPVSDSKNIERRKRCLKVNSYNINFPAS